MFKSCRFLAIAFTIAVASCSEQESVVPMSYNATVKGFVTLYTQFGGVITDRSGVDVKLTSGQNSYSTVTNEAGEYTVDVPTGSYIVTIVKQGFVTRTSTAIPVVGGPEPVYFSDWTIAECTSKVINLAMSQSSSYAFALTGTIVSERPDLASTIVFFNTSADVGPDNYINYYQPFSGTGTINATFTPSLEKGETIYAVAYGVSSSGASRYNFLTKKTEFIGIGKEASNVASVTAQ